MEGRDFFKISDGDLLFLKAQWRAAFARYASDEKSYALFEKVIESYSESRRAYHNLSHIKSLLDLGQSLKNHFSDYDAVRFAIWFHDAIYETTKSDNEERSANWASVALTALAMPQETVSKVSEMILATKHHKAESLSNDALLFLDLDLSILGADEETYRAYGMSIRKEYSWVADDIYRRERGKILEKFLQREFIYNTKEMRERFEARARINIESELKELRA
jgi:predicted metal-dependent HD superfamily phosphohydrolase